MRGCGISKKKRNRKISVDSLSPLKKLARRGGITEDIVCAYVLINIMDDKYAYYASQAVYGSGVHHDLLTTEGYDVDEELSTYNTKTYVKNGQALVAYRGTQDIADIDADATIALGTQRFSPEFKKAFKIAQRAKEKYGVVYTTGHSLGGTKALESANLIGGKAIVFNPGTGFFKYDAGDNRVYVKRQDPISVRIKGSNIDWSDGGHSLNEYEDRFNPKTKVSSRIRPMHRGVSKKRGWRF